MCLHPFFLAFFNPHSDRNTYVRLGKLLFIYFIMKFLEKYYPILLAALSVAYSNYLWFSGNQLEGLYVGLWPVTILAFAIAIRQRRNPK